MRIEFQTPSSDGIHTLAGVIYVPSGEVCGYLHIVHGMTEHMGRYDRLMLQLSAQGYICFGYDHLGHGKTAKDDSELGYIAKEKGDELLVRDVKVFSDAVRMRYDQKYGRRLPYYLMGHSMGSFVTRLAVEKYVRPDKFIIMGTGGRNPAVDAGLAMVSTVKMFNGDKHVSTALYKLAFGSYNKRFGGGTAEDPSPWLTRDEEVRRKYYADKFCNFKFTVSAMGDLIRLMKNANREAWFTAMPHVPMLLLSGEEDPVGNYGAGVKQVQEGLVKQGHHVKCILYPGARHEILNDTTYEQVKLDILSFLER